MCILLTGKSGQLGTEILRRSPPSIAWIAPDRQTLDLSDINMLIKFVEEQRPTHILHAGAWTAVDAAQAHPDEAHRVNAEATHALAGAARRAGARMLYVSTDFVFGNGHDRPILPDATPDPLSVYGATKYAGERAVISQLGDDGVIVRTSWVYASHGQNFLRTMLRLMREREQLNVVADQIGVPTWAGGLADVCLQMLTGPHAGIWHYGDAGVASWYDFACAIYREGRRLDLLDHDVDIRPIPATGYPTPAARPHFSVLDRCAMWTQLEKTPRHWHDVLRQVMDELAADA